MKTYKNFTDIYKEYRVIKCNLDKGPKGLVLERGGF